MLDQTTALHKVTVLTQGNTEALTRAIETKALTCIAAVSSSCELNKHIALDLIRSWPCISINFDMLKREALMLAGPIPSLYPMGTQRNASSIFGMV